MGQAMYEAAAAEQAAQGTDAPTSEGDAGTETDDDVVDAEIVDDDTPSDEENK
jgi:molecular chaperone DnaK